MSASSGIASKIVTNCLRLIYRIKFYGFLKLENTLFERRQETVILITGHKLHFKCFFSLLLNEWTGGLPASCCVTVNLSRSCLLQSFGCVLFELGAFKNKIAKWFCTYCMGDMYESHTVLSQTLANSCVPSDFASQYSLDCCFFVYVSRITAQNILFRKARAWFLW